jgi:hypothetical protein
MSERSFRRENARRIASAKRRESLRARKAAAAAAVVGAFALAAPAASSAANFVVDTTNTGGTTCAPSPCSLPDAVDLANANNEDDVITFDASLSGSTIDLSTGTNTGPIVVNDLGYSLTITGLGASNLTVSGGGSSQVFDVDNPYGHAFGPPPGPATYLSISGLTIADGSGDAAGGIYTDLNTYFTLDDSVVTGNTASGVFDQEGPYIIFAAAGGGLTSIGTTDISNTTFTDNHSTGFNGPFGGGGVDNAGHMTISDSQITGNDAAQYGGGLFNGGTKYPTSLDMSNTTISNNYAGNGGGGIGAFDPLGSKYGASHEQIVDSTITGNVSGNDGGGVGLKYIAAKDSWTISHSTISDDPVNGSNYADSDGGGVSLGVMSGKFTLIDSTISGNAADDSGGGVYLNGYAQKYQGNVQIQNSTIASNTAYDGGGGIYLAGTDGGPNDNKYPVHTAIGSTIVADNDVDGSPNDIDQFFPGDGLPGSGFDLSFDLVEAVGSNAEITELPPGSNIFSTDPLLGPLANNGGPTLTHLPATTSAVIDKGNAPSGLTTDQRGEPRTVDTTPANANDGTDIGSVELPAGTGPPTPPPTAGGTEGTKVHNIKKKRKKRRRVIRTFHQSAKIHLTFSSPVAGAVFTCSLDGGAFEPCTSPFSVRLDAEPGRGARHSVTIVTKDPAGNQLGQPKTFKFRIVQKT